MQENLLVFGMMAKSPSRTWTEHKPSEICLRLLISWGFISPPIPKQPCSEPCLRFLFPKHEGFPRGSLLPLLLQPSVSWVAQDLICQPNSARESKEHFAVSAQTQDRSGTSFVLFGGSWWQLVYHRRAHLLSLLLFCLCVCLGVVFCCCWGVF